RDLGERRERWEPGGDSPERAKAADSVEIPLLQVNSTPSMGLELTTPRSRVSCSTN
ncbi:unnamed protein product, partial [Gulo gulo]